jgi:hypothetical protein
LREKIQRVVTAADEISIPFCLLELQTIFRAEKSPLHPEVEDLEKTLFLSVIDAADDADGVCFEVLANMDNNHKRRVRLSWYRIQKRFTNPSQIYDIAEDHLLSTAKFSSRNEHLSIEIATKELEKILRVIDCTAQIVPQDVDSVVPTMINAHIRAFSSAIITRESDIASGSLAAQQNRLKVDIRMICLW